MKSGSGQFGDDGDSGFNVIMLQQQIDVLSACSPSELFQRGNQIPNLACFAVERNKNDVIAHWQGTVGKAVAAAPNFGVDPVNPGKNDSPEYGDGYIEDTENDGSCENGGGWVKPEGSNKSCQQATPCRKLRRRQDGPGDLFFVKQNEAVFKPGFLLVIAAALPGTAMQIGLLACAVAKPAVLIRRMVFLIWVVFP